MVGLCALETRTSVKGAAWSAYQRRITFMEGNHLGNARAITRPGTLSNCEIVQALVKKIDRNPPGPSQTRRTNPCCGPQVDEETVVMEVTKQDITGPRRDTDVTGSESFLGVSDRMNRDGSPTRFSE